MLIDKSHRTWAFWSAAALAAGSATYVLYVQNSPGGPTGGSTPGLLYGIIGSAMMVFAWLLAGRKRVRALPLGSARFWLKGHLWLGALSLPFILFHAGFGWGGLLEHWLWVVFGFVYVSGFVGLGIQQLVPRLMTARLKTETFGEQIPFQIERMIFIADKMIADETGPVEPGDPHFAELYRHAAAEYATATRENKADWMGRIPEGTRTLFRNLAAHAKNNGWVRTEDDFPGVLPKIYLGVGAPAQKARVARGGKGKSETASGKAAAATEADAESPREKIRARKAASSAEADGASAKRPSPLEQIRAKSAAAPPQPKPADSQKLSKLEQIRAQQSAAKRASPEPAESDAGAAAPATNAPRVSISEAVLGPSNTENKAPSKDGTSSSGTGLDSKAKSGLSPIEQIRAKRAAEAGIEKKKPTAKKLSPLEQIRVAQSPAEKPTAAAAPQPAADAAPRLPRQIQTPDEQRRGLRDFYLTQVRPYLQSEQPKRHALDRPQDAQRLFARIRSVLSAPALRDELDHLEGCCDERRQFAIQRRLHRVLHGWLLLHVPASMALFVLFLVHVIMALRVVPF